MGENDTREMIGEVEGLIARAERLAKRQEQDLRAMLVHSEQRELLDGLLFSLTAREQLTLYLIRLRAFPLETMNDPEFNRDLLGAQLVLTKYPDEKIG